MSEQPGTDSPMDDLVSHIRDMGFDEPSEPAELAPETDEESIQDDESLESVALEPDEIESEEDEYQDTDALEDDVEPAESAELDLSSLTLTVGDEELSVEDLRNGYLRQSDYTKKTQQVSEQRKEVEGLRDQYAHALEWMGRQWTGQLDRFNGVNWQQLQTQNPAEYQRLAGEYTQVKQSVDAVQAAQNQFLEQVQTQQKAQMEKQAKETLTNLKSLHPEWSNDTYREIQELVVNDYGANPAEIQSETRQWVMELALDAMKYRKARQQGTLKRAEPPKSKPQARSGNADQLLDARTIKAEREQLRKSRRVEDAAKVLERDLRKLFAN